MVNQIPVSASNGPNVANGNSCGPNGADNISSSPKVADSNSSGPKVVNNNSSISSGPKEVNSSSGPKVAGSNNSKSKVNKSNDPKSKIPKVSNKSKAGPKLSGHHAACKVGPKVSSDSDCEFKRPAAVSGSASQSPERGFHSRSPLPSAGSHRSLPSIVCSRPSRSR